MVGSSILRVANTVDQFLSATLFRKQVINVYCNVDVVSRSRKNEYVILKREIQVAWQDLFIPRNRAILTTGLRSRLQLLA